MLFEEQRAEPWRWAQYAFQCNHPCVSRLRKARGDAGYNLRINPHKLHRAADGRFLFAYRGLKEFLEDMDTICNDLMLQDYVIKRMDICIDSDCDYQTASKLSRLILLMLADLCGLENRYMSDDPLSLEPKTVVAANGKKYVATLEIEHYNRNLLPQDKWANDPVENRFELRAMREQAGRRHEAVRIVKNWIDRFDKLTEDHLQHVLLQVNRGLFERWKRRTSKLRSEDMSSRQWTTFWNTFLFWNSEHLYTAKQIESLFGLHETLGGWMPGGRAGVRNFLETGRRYRTGMELYTFNDIRAEAGLMADALRRFGYTQA